MLTDSRLTVRHELSSYDQVQQKTIKRRIKESFSKSAKRYDLHAIVQKEVAAMLLERISPLLDHDELILDLGSGTGYLSLPLLQMGIETIGIDLSSRMIDVARSKAEKNVLEHYQFLVADSEYLPFKDKSFAFVISSLMYQWIWGLEEGFREVSRVLKPNGFFSFTILGKDSLKELRISYKEASERLDRDGLPPLMRFPEVDSVKKAMMISGFEEVKIDKVSFSKPYKSLFHLLKMLKNIGASNPMDGKDKTFKRGVFIKVMDRIYQERFSEEGRVKATYNVLFCSGRKG